MIHNKKIIPLKANPTALPKLQDEKGFVLVLSLVILLVLSIIGVGAIQNTTVELRIAGNDRTYVEDFYVAEANAMEIARRVEAEPSENLQDSDINMGSGITASGMIKSDSMTQTYDALDEEQIQRILTTTDYGNIAASGIEGGRFAAVDKGIDAGSSLSLPNASQLHTFDVYGYSSQNNSHRIVRIGYRKRF